MTGKGTLLLNFTLPAGRPAVPFIVALRFRNSDGSQPRQHECNVAGHAELRLRPFDSSRDLRTNHRAVDERLLKVYEDLHGAGYDEDQVQAFCRLLTAVCRAAIRVIYDKRYRAGQNVQERQFHNDLHNRLLGDPELGGRVERGRPLALGFFDVRHDGITAELLVERRTAVTIDNVTKYIGQPTQYAGADGARLSILCVLDISKKSSPPGTLENYIWPLKPELHGLTNPEAPSIVMALVINAGLQVPSSWSGKRVPVQQ